MTKEEGLEVISEFEAIENEIAQITREYQRRKDEKKLTTKSHLDFNETLAQLMARRDELNAKVKQICLSLGISEQVLGQLDERADNQAEIDRLQEQIDALEIPTPEDPTGSRTLTARELKIAEALRSPEGGFNYSGALANAQRGLANVTKSKEELINKIKSKQDELKELEDELAKLDSPEFEADRKMKIEELKKEIKEYKAYVKKNGMFSALSSKFDENKRRIEILTEKEDRTEEEEKELKLLNQEQEGLQEKINAYPDEYKNFDIAGKQSELKLLSSKKKYKAERRKEIESKIKDITTEIGPDLEQIDKYDGEIQQYNDAIEFAQRTYQSIEQDGVLKVNLEKKQQELKNRQKELATIISSAVGKIEVKSVMNGTRALDETETRTTQPAQGATPSSPVQGATPSSPAQGATPSRPVQGATPSSPTQGATPSSPVQGATPSSPVQGATPSSPVQGATPSRPVQGATPSRPVQGATPSRPVQATGTVQDTVRTGNASQQAPQHTVENVRTDGTVTQTTQNYEQENDEQTLPVVSTSKKGPMISPNYLAAIQKAYKEKTTQELVFDNFKRPHMPFLGRGFGKKERAELTEILFPDDMEGKEAFANGNKRELYALKKAGITPEILQWAMMEMGVITEEHLETHEEWKEEFEKFQEEQEIKKVQQARVSERSSFLKQVLSQEPVSNTEKATHDEGKPEPNTEKLEPDTENATPDAEEPGR